MFLQNQIIATLLSSLPSKTLLTSASLQCLYYSVSNGFWRTGVEVKLFQLFPLTHPCTNPISLCSFLSWDEQQPSCFASSSCCSIQPQKNTVYAEYEHCSFIESPCESCLGLCVTALMATSLGSPRPREKSEHAAGGCSACISAGQDFKTSTDWTWRTRWMQYNILNNWGTDWAPISVLRTCFWKCEKQMAKSL